MQFIPVIAKLNFQHYSIDLKTTELEVLKRHTFAYFIGLQKYVIPVALY